jgi:predicted RNA binding protein YcfA (HicA-like mRNA interferase family)
MDSGVSRAAMKYRDLIKLLEGDGWYWVSTKGSHQKFRHPPRKGR